MSEVDAYTAGLIDGEGSVMLMRRSASSVYRTPAVSVTSTSEELLKFLRREYGGCIRVQKRYRKHHAQAWLWSVVQNRALRLLERVAPYLREAKKKLRAELLLTAFKALTPRNGKYTPEAALAKQAFEEHFMSL